LLRLRGTVVWKAIGLLRRASGPPVCLAGQLERLQDLFQQRPVASIAVDLYRRKGPFIDPVVVKGDDLGVRPLVFSYTATWRR
jgi:hypothetical protein